jgi:ATP-binding cassette subfamily F protein uup
VLLVSHDRAFLDHVVTSTLAFEGDGRVVEYVGGWQDYLRQAGGEPAAAPARRAAASASEARAASGARPADPAVKRKLSYKEQRELEQLPKQIETLETEQQRLRTESEGSEFYRETADHIRGVLARLEAVGPELEALIARWMDLEERAQL